VTLRQAQGEPEHTAAQGEPEHTAKGESDLLDRARAWHDQDPDETTRAELATLILAAEQGDAEGVTELGRRFEARLEFGTAGLRGELGAGPNRMNRVLVAQAAAGFAAYLLEKGADPISGAAPSVVVGYDGRVNSQVFARDTAELMAGAGVRAILLPRLLPTPVLAFAVRHLGVSAGVMVTASHNPARDNGYKVYLGGFDDGSQIVSPADGEIAAHILRVAGESSVLELPRSDDYETADESVVDEYVRRTAAIATTTTAPLTVVYTAMHGVGWQTARRVFAEAGFAEPLTVAEQIDPDDAFPTVDFPNPEEPGALDLAFAAATAADADLIIANDPDADRLAIAIPTADGWKRLSGNDVGALLGWRAAERLATSGENGTLAASIVSSPALGAIASQYHLDYAETLTGFKWVSRVGGLGYGFEEALGYLVDPDKVRDKDGISAAVDFLSLVTELAARGETVEDRQRALAERIGAFSSSQISLRVSDLGAIPVLMARLRDAPPATIGSLRVDRIDDFADGFGAFPPGDILRIHLEGGARVIVRPSGTEPKLKVYIDASSDAGTADERRAAADAVVAKLDRELRALLG
jgi:phosphomannomutase